MAIYIVEGYTDSNVKGTGWEYKANPKGDSMTRQEAEQYSQDLSKTLNEPHRVKEFKSQDEFKRYLQGGGMVITQSVEDRRAESRKRALKERARLAQQAAEKQELREQGEKVTISKSERRAFKIESGGFDLPTQKETLRRLERKRSEAEQINLQKRILAYKEQQQTKEGKSSGFIIPQGKTKGISDQDLNFNIQQPQKRQQRTPNGTISAASKELKTATRQAKFKEGVGGFLSGFGAGFFGNAEQAAEIEKNPRGLTIGEAGLYSGTVFSFLPLGRAEDIAKVGKTTITGVGKASKQAILKAKNVIGAVGKSKAGTTLKAASKTKIGKATIGLGTSLAVGETNLILTETGIKATAPKEQRKIIFSKDFNKNVVGTGLRAEEKSLKNQPFYKRLGNEVSLLIGDKTTYKQTITQIAENRGLTGKEKTNFINAAMRARSAKGSGEIASYISIGAVSEIVGEGIIKTGFKTIGKTGKKFTQKEASKKVFTEAFKDIALVGATEGGTQELIKQQVREQDINIKNIGFSAGLGALSAGILGGAIPATSTAGKKGLSKTLEIGSYITDPYEFLGDITAKGVIKSTSKVTKRPITTPAIFTAGSDKKQTFTFGISTKTPKTKVQTPAGSIGIGTPLQTPTKTKTSTQTQAKTQTKTPTLENLIIPFPSINTNTRTDPDIITPVKPPVKTPVNIPTITNTFTRANTPASTETPTETNINTPTNIMSNIFSNVPTITPQLRIPPPIPLSLQTGSSYGGARARKRTKFIDELSISQNLFKGLTGISGIPKPIKRKSKTSKKKSKKKKKKQPQAFDPLKFIFG